MSYDTLKNTITEAIRPNGNQEITGQILQDILLSILDEAAATDKNIIDKIDKEFGDGIKLEQLAFAESINLFNENDEDYQIGYYLTSKGLTQANQTYNTSGYIKVEEATEYSFGTRNTSGGFESVRFVAFYDSQKVIIGSLLSNVSNTISPAGAAYMRVSVHAAYSNYQIVKGDTLPEYSPYQLLIPQKAIMPAPKEGGNEIAMPAYHYMLTGVQNDIFHDTYLKFWNPYKWSVEIINLANVTRRLERVISVINPKDNANITFNVWNAESNEVESRVVSKTRVGTPSIGTTPISISIIGDSYTNGDFFVKALLENGFVPQLSMLGLRRVSNKHLTQHDEGRGGWRLSTYFTPPHQLDDVTFGFNPFFQPNGSARCWGSNQFWLNAIGCANGTYTSADDEWYQCSMYNDYVGLFDSATGYLANPTTNDIMYDRSNERYVKWDGSAWVTTNYTDYTWGFDYAKYLAMWNIPSPSMLFVYLGVNDFWNNEPTEAALSTWMEEANTIANSYLTTTSNGKLVIMLPNTVTMRNSNQYQSLQVHRNMWAARKAMIMNFDGREGENIYVLDSSLAIDSEHSFAISTDSKIVQPFDGYSGDDNFNATTDGQHPRLSYETLGYSLAAFIQYWR